MKNQNLKKDPDLQLKKYITSMLSLNESALS